VGHFPEGVKFRATWRAAALYILVSYLTFFNISFFGSSPRALCCSSAGPHTHTHTHTHIQTHLQSHTHTHVQSHTHTRAVTHTHTRAVTHKHTCIQTHVQSHTPVHSDTHVQTHTHTCAHTHVQTHTHTREVTLNQPQQLNAPLTNLKLNKGLKSGCQVLVFLNIHLVGFVLCPRISHTHTHTYTHTRTHTHTG